MKLRDTTNINIMFAFSMTQCSGLTCRPSIISARHIANQRDPYFQLSDFWCLDSWNGIRPSKTPWSLWILFCLMNELAILFLQDVSSVRWTAPKPPSTRERPILQLTEFDPKSVFRTQYDPFRQPILRGALCADQRGSDSARFLKWPRGLNPAYWVSFTFFQPRTHDFWVWTWILRWIFN